MIGVIGDSILDHYLIGENNRVSQEGPYLLIDIIKKETVRGGAGHVYDQICEVDMPSKFYSDFKVAHKTRIQVNSQIILRYDEEDINLITETEKQSILNNIKNDLNILKCIVISDYKKGVVSADLIKKLKSLCSYKVPIIIDPKNSINTYAQGVYALKMNRNYVGKEFKVDSSLESIKSITHEIYETARCENLIITLDKDGAIVYNHDMGLIHLKVPEQLEVRDVTGAGDIMVAMLAVGIAKGHNFINNCINAFKYAIESIKHVGTVIVNQEFKARRKTLEL